MTALGQYKDLRAAGYIDPRHDTLEHINLPLLVRRLYAAYPGSRLTLQGAR